MNASLPSLSLDAIQAALRKTTELLARELACPSDEAPQWSAQEWLIARATASMHGVSALLASRLRWSGPPGWCHFLNAQREHTAGRHKVIQGVLRGLDQRLRGAGIAGVALKGCELHARGLYAPGERPMADIDLLVAEHELPRTAELLRDFGLEQTFVNERHHTFESPRPQAASAFGEHVRNDVKIELHAHLREHLLVRAIDITKHVLSSAVSAGLNGYPSHAALMLHILLHAAGAMKPRALRLLHLQDITRLCEHATQADWHAFIELGGGAPGSMWWALPPLAVAARYEATVPDWVLDHPALRGTALLARRARRWTLSDVSLSYLRVTAFPGIEWAQSPREMVSYVQQRVWPSADLLASRRYLARTHRFHRETRWGQMSQHRRLLMWLTQGVPRSETIFAVQTALAQVH